MLNKEKFLALYQKVPVPEYPNEVRGNPKVSVCIQTYQHESYIEKCIEGILMQITDFDVEILIGEDESSDKTREICISYAKKYPDSIRLFLHSRKNNIHVFGKPTGNFNYRYNMYHARGKYVAICEGDDFWVDPLKLQKQVDYLEANPEFGMIFSDIVMVDENDKEIETTEFHKKIKTLYKSGNVFWDLLAGNFINTLTVCMHKDLVVDYINRFSEEHFNYDFRLWLHIAAKSKIKYVDEVWAFYRHHSQGISRSKGFFDKRTPLVQQSALVNYLIANNKEINEVVFGRTVFNILTNKHLKHKEKRPTVKILMKSPKNMLIFSKWLLKKIFNNF